MSEQCEFGKCEDCPVLRTTPEIRDNLSNTGNEIAEYALDYEGEDRSSLVEKVGLVDEYSDSSDSLTNKLVELCDDGPLTMSSKTSDGRTIMVTVCTNPLIPVGITTHCADVLSLEPDFINQE